jgi:membrane protein insertase Oxa1/YidC/SpoIIIJ
MSWGKFSKDPMKKQETMKLYNAGVNPMAGCIPTKHLYFMLFLFLSFGNKFETKGFLWADDLSSFDHL